MTLVALAILWLCVCMLAHSARQREFCLAGTAVLLVTVLVTTLLT